MKKKVTYIISDINRAIAFEWVAAYLNKDKFELSFILLNKGNSVLEDHLKAQNFNVIRIHHSGKLTWPSTVIKLYNHFKSTRPHIIHCHLKVAATLGLIAGKLAHVPVRIHTRHHSSLHHIYFSKGVFWDRLNNKLSTHIIAISGEVKKILIEWEKRLHLKYITFRTASYFPNSKIVTKPLSIKLEPLTKSRTNTQLLEWFLDLPIGKVCNI